MVKLRIGFVLDDTLDTSDGVQQYVLNLGKWLSRRGHTVHYLVGETSRTDIKNVHSMSKNFKVRFNQNRLSTPLPANKKLIAKTLAELKLDIIHVQVPYSPLMAGRIIKAVSPSTKVIGTFHIVPANLSHYLGSYLLEIFGRSTLKQFDQVISVSQAAASFARKTFGIESVIIPNGIEIKKLKRRPIKNKVPHIVFLGRLVERKGPMFLLKALLQLQKQYKGNYTVTIAGRGPLGEKLKKFAKSKKIKHIKFTGFVEEKDKPKLLAGADIAVFPSIGGESFGIVLIEAMAAGSRVVLGGDNVGYQCVLGDHPDLLVNARDSIGFANRMQYYLEHKDAQKSAAKWAAASIKQYDVSITGAQTLKIYQKGH